MMSPIVSASWLRDNLDKVVLFDAGYHLPTVKRDPVAEFDAAHIPGALRFDINIIADQSNPLPHMLPSADDFTTAMRALGVAPPLLWSRSACAVPRGAEEAARAASTAPLWGSHVLTC